MRNNMSLVLVVLTMVVMFCFCKGCLEEERDALLQFKAFVLQNLNGTDEASVALSSWIVGGQRKSSCCDWERVECNLTTGRVIRLSLHSLRKSPLFGPWSNWNLNATMFLPFKELQYLNLYDNDITGWLENEGLERLSILPKLEVLDLTSNKFNNSILASLNAFPSLKKLYLGANWMMRDRPNCLSQGQVIFSRLKKLEVLHLGTNYLDNSINLSSLAAITSLKELHLDYNYFKTSSLCSENFEIFQHLKKLEILDLSSNNFDKSVWVCLGALSSLKKLDLSNNELNGPLPPENFEIFQHLKKLEILDLSSTNLDKSGLAYLGALSSLKELDLSYNELNETLPPGFLRLSTWNKLEILDLSENKFIIDDVLPSLATFTSLKSLSLSSNMFSLTNQGGQECNFSSLGTLTSLEKLDLSLNDLNGAFPKGLCKLKNLQELYLKRNNFHGILPSCLSNLTSLEVLDLSDNSFEATFLLMSLANHSKLVKLHLDGNYLNTHLLQAKIDNHEYRQYKLLPKSQLKVLTMSNCYFNKHTKDALLEFLHDQYNLVELRLSHVDLQVDFPIWLIENNTNLEILEFRNSSLKGQFSLPSHSHLSLIVLDISNNHIQGTVQNSIGEILPNLIHLNLSTNAFGGSLPSSISAMRMLEVLDLSSNIISGELPESWALGCVSLMSLKLSNNDLHGPIFPGDYSNLNELRFLHLDGNKFIGNIPLGVSKSSYLRVFNVGTNNLSGTIPAWIGNLTYLQALFLRENSLEGFIPHEFCTLHELMFLDLSHNHDLRGSIPSCLELSSLEVLHLQANRFTGSIQDISLIQSSNSSLVTLDLADNNFSGSIPNWIGEIFKLKFLSLKGNHLNGSIPYQLCQLNQIGILDLSHNKLSGSIPPCLMNITFGSTTDHNINVRIFGPSPLTDEEDSRFFELSELVEVEIMIKSKLSSYKGKMLNMMFGMDLSCNNLTGEIPCQIGGISELHGLNLSHNQLSGKIPTTLSNMKQLESLDLSHNKLSGEIPSSLNKLNFLGVFFVTYNNLWGRTPIGGQFDTFNEFSYSGNPLLCGTPPLVLANNCLSLTEETPTMRSSSFVTTWGDKYDINAETFLVSFVVTCVMCLFSFFIVLYINPYWRQRWFHFIEGRIIDLCLYFFIDVYYKLFVHPFM